MDWHTADTLPKEGEALVEDKFGMVWLIECDNGYPKANGCGCCAEKIYDIVRWMPVPKPETPK